MNNKSNTTQNITPSSYEEYKKNKYNNLSSQQTFNPYS